MAFAVFQRIKDRWNHPHGYKTVLAIGLPLIASMASTTIMQFTDRLFLSMYSIESIAAALPAAMLSLTCFLTLTGLCSYSGVLIAHYVGANQPGKVGPALWQGVWCSFGGCVLLLFLCYIAEDIFGIWGHEPDILEQEIVYFQILNAGSCLALVGGSVASFLYGKGQARPIMVANLLAAAINIPLDYVLIFGIGPFPEMGIVGAGIATSVGWLVNMLIMVTIVFTRTNDKDYQVLGGWRFDWSIFSRLLRYGLPSALNFFIELMAVSWFIFEMGRLGRVALAAGNIAFSISSVLYLPLIGLNIAVSILVGQAMGRREPFEVEKLTFSALHLSISFIIPMVILLLAIPGPLIDIFLDYNSSSGSIKNINEIMDVKNLGVMLLFYVAIYGIFDASNVIFIGALKGVGDTMAVLVMLAGTVMLMLVAPLLYIRNSSDFSVNSIWLIFTIYMLGLGICAIVRFKSRAWHKINVIKKT